MKTGMKKLYIIGMGPGAGDLVVPRAMTAIEASSDIVAYSAYLDLLGGLLGDSSGEKTYHDSPLGEETGRACLALDLAAGGKTTALVSSGDIGIYAMATVVFELLDQQLQGKVERPEWMEVAIEVIPGISAMQAGAASVGAMLGHDFCTVSLSDLLTSWETIARRVHACGQGDFVVSFYNPRSQKRDWQINAARDILLEYRSGETPVLLGRQLTRDDESITITTLEKLHADSIDMFTVVLVGNSESRHIHCGENEWVYTPRGYSKKP